MVSAARAQQAGRWQHPPADDLEPFERGRRIVKVGLEQERERFALERSSSYAPSSPSR